MNQKPDFSKLNGIVPCVVQDAASAAVLMVAFMNEAAWEKTIAGKKATFFSRSRQRLWTKGETSGNFLRVVDMILDCDKDAILLKVHPEGPVCHTGQDTCFNEINERFALSFLERIIQQRKVNPQPGSYTTSLVSGGINTIAQKLGEEAIELIIEAKDDNQSLFLNEAADLLYHYLVLLSAKGTSLGEVTKVLAIRHREADKG